jgi:predicted GNAT family N-acyltransferase
MTPAPPTCRRASIDEIYELRFNVLRPKQNPVKLHFPGDGAEPPQTWHFGAFTSDGRTVACLTLFASEWEGQPAMQLRGMAVAEEVRGTGLGRQLLLTAQTAVADDPVAKDWRWWCNARTTAIGFYEKLGWEVASGEFMIEGVGPHKKMVRIRGGK